MNYDPNSPDFFFDDELEDSSPYANENLSDATPEKPSCNVVFDHPDPSLPAAERIEELMGSMSSSARTLQSIIAFCAEPKPVAEVNELVDESKQDSFSIYSAAALCSLLERAGAIERVDENGNLISKDAEPELVEEDGVAYLEPAAAKPSFWRATPEGTASLEGPSASDKLAALLDESQRYLPIFQRILSLCAQEQGTSAKALADAVDDDPLLQEPRRYASFFVEKLEDCDAITWHDGAWRITESGTAALA